MKISTSILANKYGVSVRTINNWVRSKKVKAKVNPVNNRIIWDNESLECLARFVNTKVRKDEPQSINHTFEIANRRYLGAKSRMLEFINTIVDKHTEGVKSVADIFGGTGVVADSFYRRGFDIIINDILDSNWVAYQSFFSKENIDSSKIDKLIDSMNNLSLKDNYVSINYGNKFFSYENAQKIGEAREFIEQQSDLSMREKSILLTSLLYAMDKVANTVGHYDAYRRVMDSNTPVVFKRPNVFNSNRDTKIFHQDANDLVKRIKADLIYIDTPYNSRQYGDVYHVLENVIDWKKPKLYGVAMKPKDRSKTKSDYSTSKAPLAFDDLIQNINAKYILVSYNNMAQKGAGRSNAKISNDEIVSILEKKGKVTRYELPFQVYTTGKTKIENHSEYLYLVKVTKEK